MQGIFELFFLLGFLGLGLGCLSFLCRFLKAGEEAFFLLGRGFQIAADAFDLSLIHIFFTVPFLCITVKE